MPNFQLKLSLLQEPILQLKLSLLQEPILIILAIVLISQASAYSEDDVMEQNLGYGVGPPTKQGNSGHHHIVKREPVTLTTLTTILTTLGPILTIVVIVLIVVVVSLLVLFIVVTIIIYIVGGTGTVAALGIGKRRRRREADFHPLSSWLDAAEPETFVSIIDSIR